MAPQGPAYNVDWLLSNTSNVHVAAHRDWFTTYTEFPTKIAQMLGAEASVVVHGVGTVVLETRCYDDGERHKSSRKITLHDVLYVPGFRVNIFAFCVNGQYDMATKCGTDVVSPITMRETGKTVGLVVRNKLFRLWLKGQSKKQTTLDPKSSYYFHATWPEQERIRWERHMDTSTKGTEETASFPRLTSNEKLVLTSMEKLFRKKHYGGELEFLQTHGLKMHDEGDRAVGRRILRSIMADEDLNASPKGSKGTLSNPPLTDTEKQFLKKHYVNEFKFLRDHGFKIHDEDDRAAGRDFLRSIMADDDDCQESASIVNAFQDMGIGSKPSEPKGLPSGNWENLIAHIDTLDRQANGLWVLLTFKDGQRVRQPVSTVYKRCPQKMLQFYESHF